jgi:molecular chaperone IbpA|tara:strand:- start:69 stop:479 length:411 start_codon:yes stop_codon:yes gene_type:complete
MHDLLNLNKFLNNAIGFEDVFERLSSFNNHNTGFPYYNIKKKDSDKYSLEMTLAGYKKSDIEVEIAEGIITVSGKAAKEDKEEYVYKGMAQRAFTRKLQLADYVEAKGAALEDGILKIKLEYCPPDDKKPKKIEIK